MKKIYLLFFAVLSFVGAFAQINVTATAGTTGPTTYTTLKLAFDAINAGTHQGAITIDVTASTTEGATPATLNSSGAGSASYTSVLIRPTADGVSISGNPVTGFGVVQLKGADNVTIDGDNPNTSGTNRNLTINNTATTTVVANSVIRIATAATVVTSADNITIKNCILNGNVTSGNASAITSATGSSGISFGIYCGGNGGATAIDAPTALTSATTQTAPSGTTINNLLIDNNVVNQCSRGIQFNGAASSVSTGVVISNNTVGAAGSPGTFPFTTPATTVYTKGIWVAGTNAITINNNTVQNIISYVGTPIAGIEISAATGTGTIAISNNTVAGVSLNAVSGNYARGISVLQAGGPYSISRNTVTNINNNTSSLTLTNQPNGIFVATTAASAIIESNKVATVIDRNTGTDGVAGVYFNGGNNITFRNNFLSDVNEDITGGLAFSTSFGVCGLRIAAGTGHKIYHNTIHLSGALLGTSNSSVLTTAFAITSTSLTGIDVRNNIFSNVMTGGTTSIAHVAMWLPSAGTSAMGLTLNNNAYYSGTDATRQGIAQAGTTAGTQFYLASNFNAGSTTPSTNLRNYSSTLGATTNDNASYAFSTAAPFVSSTDFHIPNATLTPLESSGAALGVTNDIDGDVRNVTTPDIGADEFNGVYLDAVAPSISYTTLSNTLCISNRTISATITDAGGVNTTAGTKPRIWFKKSTNANVLPGTNTNTTDGWKYVEASNAASPFTLTIDNSLIFGGVAAGDIIQYFVVAQDNAATPNVGINSGTFTGTPTSVALATGNFPIGGTINSFTFGAGGLSGTVTIGATGTYTSLTGAGGLFAALNTGGLTGNLTANIIDASVTESGANALNQLSNGCGGPFTLTIKPSATSTLTGSLASNALIRILSNNVTIDGSNSGGTTRDLTITNTSTTSPSVLLFGSIGTTPITSSTLKNTIIINGATTATAVVVSDGTTLGSAGYFNNITLQNNSIQKAYIGIYNTAVPVAGNGSGLNITSNVLNTTGANQIRYTGIYVQGVDGGIISGNNVGNFEITSDETKRGIWLATGTTNTLVTKNVIHDVKYTGINGYGAYGVAVSSGLAAANDNITNNMVFAISSDADSYASFGGTYSPVGLYVFGAGQGGVNLYNNTIYMSGNTLNFSSGAYSFGILLDNGASANVRNNIINNNLGRTTTTGIGAVGIAASTSASQFTAIDYNDYVVASTGSGTNSIGKIGSTDYATLAAWQAVSGGDTHSINIVPSYVSATDLHLNPAISCNFDGKATPIAIVTTDIDGDPRDATTPDIGADEFTSTFVLVVTNPAAVCSPNTVDITAPAVTAGSTPSGTLTYWADAAATTPIPPANGTPAAITVSGTYYIQSTGTGGCSVIKPVVVTINPLPVITPTLTQPSTCASSDGAISLAISGATGPFTYSWTGTGVNPTAQNQTGLTIGNYSVTVTSTSTLCSSTASFSLVGPGGCFVCPTIGALASNPSTPVCSNTSVALNVTGLTNMGVTYGILYKYSTTALADPYTGGTTIATVPNASLGGGGTTATTSTTFAANTYFVYAILSPTPVDPACRPSKVINLVVNANPNATISYTGSPYCQSAGTANVTLTGTTGGSFTSTAGLTLNPATGAVTLASSTPGSYLVTYTVAAAGGCSAFVTTANITVTATPSATITYAGNPFCTSGPGTQTVTRTGTAGGTYSSTAGLTINAATGDITVGTSTPGSYVVTYTVAASGGCATYTTTTTVLIANCTVSVTATVGTLGPVNYPNLKYAFDAINAGTHKGVVAVSINANTTETAQASLNRSGSGAASYTSVTVRPTADNLTLTGNIPSTAVVKLNAATNVTIDGDNAGSAGINRNLTITNTSTTAPSIVWIGGSLAAPATADTLRNCILINGANTASGVVTSDNTTLGTAGYFSSVAIQNNSIQKAYIANYNIAVSAAGNGSGLNVSNNDINTAGANSVRLVGVYVQGVDGATVANNNIGNIANTLDAANITGIWAATATVNTTISGNSITTLSGTASAPRGIVTTPGVANANLNVTGNTVSGLTSSSTGTTTGIWAFAASSGITIQKNKISNIKNTQAIGFGANGIQLGSTLTTANSINVYNNFVSDVAAVGFNGTAVGDNGYGIIITGGGGYNLYYNTVVMNTNQTVATGLPAALNVTSGVTTNATLNIRNNIFVNTQTVGTQRYCVFSGATAARYADINYNDYYFTGPNLGNIGGTLRANLAAWQAGTTKDANSLSVQPNFVSATDFHLTTSGNCLLDAAGTPITTPAITTDIDGDTRNATTPDLGADEFISAPRVAAIAYSGSPYCPSGTATVTQTGVTGGTYSSTTGLTIDPATGAINLATSTIGTYTVTYSVPVFGGCAAFAVTTSVTIGTLSTAPTAATASVTSICGSGTVNLSVVGGTLGTGGTGASWKWYTGSCGGTFLGTGATLTNIPVAATTTFYVRAEGSCNTTTCASVTVTQSPAPVITITGASSTNITPGRPATVFATVSPANAGYVYQWFKNGTVVPGVTGDRITVKSDELGTYTAKVTSPAGCSATSNAVVVKDSASGRIFVTPNPNQGVFHVKFYANSTSTFPLSRTLTIYDNKGALVYSKAYSITAPYTDMPVDLTTYGHGLYIIIVRDNSGNKIAEGKVDVL